ncbi:hypothetical protein F0U62_07375 [Cystobacter fuscus]|uniref:hypothetical protein n=1 Tax=Cystobacter fuscus TaxID=43 RepID=UPI002B2DAD88|nr:hypothetical protein F0U62_07375 [Cystobacter fuscus]
MAGVAADEKFLSTLDEMGGSSGNYALMQQLGWPGDKYWKIRDELVDSGQITVGKGRGGSVQRVVIKKSQSKKKEPAPVAAPTKEEDLYPYIEKVLNQDWAKHERLTDHVIEITARQGSRRTGGTWTRPDIVVVSKKRFAYVPGELFDVWTFEIKQANGIDITGIFEAAAHAKRATRSYAMFEVPEESEELGELLGRCDEEAARLNVGFITFTEASDFSTWDIRIPAPRLETDPEMLEDFIAEQLSEKSKDRIRKL